MTLRIPSLSADPDAPFPPVALALDEPDGLLAFGGDLSPARLLGAYRQGIFPWYSEGEPILWWSPSRRAVFRTDGVHLSRRLRRELRRSAWTIRADSAFAAVVSACANAPRPGQAGTWISPDMQRAYLRMHQLGHAHSIEVFDGSLLVGGLYGVAVGRLFCGESMCSMQSGASSAALGALALHLRAWGFPLIDAQVPNAHTRMLGVETWTRPAFMDALQVLRETPDLQGSWRERFGEMPAAQLAAQAPT